MTHLLSLAAGVVQEFAPERVVRAAAEVGFAAAGVWFDAATWTAARTAAVREALSETGIDALDIEVAWFQPGASEHAYDAIADVGLELGAHNLLAVSFEPESAATKRRLEHLCRRVEGSDMRIVLEFFAFTTVKSLADALEIVRDVGHPAAGIMIDTLHFERTGARLEEVTRLDANLLPYAQICDAPKAAPTEGPDPLADEALFGRLLPGEGDLPLAALLDALPPQLPLSVEVRSRVLAERYPDDIVGRSRTVFQATRDFLAARAD
jgi:sugar phosphate isomerase/epimerase